MVDTVLSADGTAIAFEAAGRGPALVIVGGALSTRHSASALARILESRFMVYSYDRRGKGDSGDTPPYAVEREIEDLRAVGLVAGSSACFYGQGSGAAIALEAAERGVPMSKIAVYDPPYRVDLAADQIEARAARIDAALEAGSEEEALEIFVGDSMPDTLGYMKQAAYWPGMVRLAHTLPYDFAIARDGAIPPERFAAVGVPALVMNGGDSPSWEGRTVEAIVRSIPGAERLTIGGQDDEVDPATIAPFLMDFFG
jgi:pimeloyl-ACP methyl ester carboxylesterase